MGHLGMLYLRHLLCPLKFQNLNVNLALLVWNYDIPKNENEQINPQTLIYRMQKFLGLKSVDMTERFLKFDLKVAQVNIEEIDTFS